MAAAGVTCLGWSIVTSIVLVHLICFGLVLNWNSPQSLLGKKNYVWNRYYSTRTTHVHKFNLLSTSVSEALTASDPSHWESLGLIIPAPDENYQIQKFDIVQDYTGVRATKPCEYTGMSSCLLENNHGDYVFLNGDSLSIISQISPSVYLATLMIIYLLSSIPFVSYSVAHISDMTINYESMIKYTLSVIVLIVYFGGLIFAYGTSPFMNETKFELGLFVRYTISSHMPSIIACTLIVILYLLHLRGRNLSWFKMVGNYMQLSSQDNQSAPSETPAPVDQAGFNAGMVNDSANSQGFAVDGKSSYSRASLNIGPMKSISGVYFVPATNMRQSTQNGFFTKINDLWAYTPREIPQQGNPELGPDSSESSVIAALTVFLGGIGSLGVLRGVIPEVDVQLILACTVGFALLEVCSNRLQAFKIFIHTIITDSSTDTDAYTSEKSIYTNGVNFICFVVLWLKLWLIVLYYNTTLHQELIYTPLQRLVSALFFLYWITQFIIYLGVFSDYMCNWGSFRYGLSLDFIFCFIAFTAIFLTLFGYSLDTGLHADDWLERYEKLQYGLTSTAKENRNCARTSTLKTNNLVNLQLMSAKDEVKDWEAQDRWVSSQAVDPVDLKVFFWTKGWNLDLSLFPSIQVWFCTNGLEHHWGQCQYSLAKYGAQMPKAVQSKIQESVKIF